MQRLYYAVLSIACALLLSYASHTSTKTSHPVVQR
jgi:hypothetical protein